VIKYETFIIKTFDQVKKHNFNQVNFGQTTPCHCTEVVIILEVILGTNNNAI
jgi:hypothetical protein